MRAAVKEDGSATPAINLRAAGWKSARLKISFD